jgi:hypothetical protein
VHAKIPFARLSGAGEVTQQRRSEVAGRLAIRESADVEYLSRNMARRAGGLASIDHGHNV